MVVLICGGFGFGGGGRDEARGVRGKCIMKGKSMWWMCVVGVGPGVGGCVI